MAKSDTVKSKQRKKLKAVSATVGVCLKEMLWEKPLNEEWTKRFQRKLHCSSEYLPFLCPPALQIDVLGVVVPPVVDAAVVTQGEIRPVLVRKIDAFPQRLHHRPGQPIIDVFEVGLDEKGHAKKKKKKKKKVKKS